MLEFFESLSFERIQQLVLTKQEEHLHLDFKTVGRDDLSDAEDRRNLAKAISGFANSEGGVIIWGVDARPDADKIDRATAERPIADVQRFLSRLNDLTGEATSPLVSGVRHVALARGDSGFAATLVPASDSGPHMAKLREQRYFKRSGSSFYPMEHFDIADMFGRRAHPKLSLSTRILSAGSVGGGGQESYRGKLVLSIHNSGRGVARAPFIEFRLSEGYGLDPGGLGGSTDSGLARLDGADPGNPHRFAGRAYEVVHPGTDLDVTAVRLTVQVNHKLQISPPSLLEIAYGLAAEGVPLERGRLCLSESEIIYSVLPERLHPPRPAG